MNENTLIPMAMPLLPQAIPAAEGTNVPAALSPGETPVFQGIFLEAVATAEETKPAIVTPAASVLPNAPVSKMEETRVKPVQTESPVTELEYKKGEKEKTDAAVSFFGNGFLAPPVLFQQVASTPDSEESTGPVLVGDAREITRVQTEPMPAIHSSQAEPVSSEMKTAAVRPEAIDNSYDSTIRIEPPPAAANSEVRIRPIPAEEAPAIESETVNPLPIERNAPQTRADLSKVNGRAMTVTGQTEANLVTFGADGKADLADPVAAPKEMDRVATTTVSNENDRVETVVATKRTENSMEFSRSAKIEAVAVNAHTVEEPTGKIDSASRIVPVHEKVAEKIETGMEIPSSEAEPFVQRTVAVSQTVNGMRIPTEVNSAPEVGDEAPISFRADAEPVQAHVPQIPSEQVDLSDRPVAPEEKSNKADAVPERVVNNTPQIVEEIPILAAEILPAGQVLKAFDQEPAPTMGNQTPAVVNDAKQLQEPTTEDRQHFEVFPSTSELKTPINNTPSVIGESAQASGVQKDPMKVVLEPDGAKIQLETSLAKKSDGIPAEQRQDNPERTERSAQTGTTVSTVSEKSGGSIKAAEPEKLNPAVFVANQHGKTPVSRGAKQNISETGVGRIAVEPKVTIQINQPVQSGNALNEPKMSSWASIGSEVSAKAENAAIAVEKVSTVKGGTRRQTLQSERAEELTPALTTPVSPLDQNAPVKETVSKTVAYEPKEVINQIARGTHVMVRDGAVQMQMRLDPPELGRVELRIAVEQDGIKAHFVTESQTVKAIIETNLPHLRDALQQAGVQADSLSVSVGGRWAQGGNGGSGFAGRENHPFYAPNYHYGNDTMNEPVYRESEPVMNPWLGRINLKA